MIKAQEYITFENDRFGIKPVSYRILDDKFLDDFEEVLDDVYDRNVRAYARDKKDTLSLQKLTHFGKAIQGLFVRENILVDLNYLNSEDLQILAKICEEGEKRQELPHLKQSYKTLANVFRYKMSQSCATTGTP